MLKYKRVTTPTLLGGKDNLVDMIAGMAGKNRHIVSIATTGDNLDFLRVYRDAEQILDCDCALVKAGTGWLKMDIPLAEGQQCKVGIFPTAAGGTFEITIGYDEAS